MPAHNPETVEGSGLQVALQSLDVGTLLAAYGELSQFAESFHKNAFLGETFAGYPALRESIAFVPVDGVEFSDGFEAALEGMDETREGTFIRGFTAAMILLVDYATNETRKLES